MPAAPIISYPLPYNAPATQSYPIPEVDDRYTRPTLIRLGKVSLSVPAFTWMLLPGALAYTATLDVFPKTHTALERLGVGPHELEIVAPSGVHGEQRLLVKGVYLREPRAADEFRMLWKISDRRVWLDYSKYSGFHNLRRKVNDRVGLDPQTLFGYSVEAYRPYSVFKAINKDGSETRQPWTALGLLRKILQGTDPGGLAGYSYTAVSDNGVPVESLDPFEERPSMLLSELMRLAEVSLFVDFQSKYVFFDRTKPTALLDVMRARGIIQGRIINQNNKRTRPSRLEVRFRAERETECLYEEVAVPTTPLTPEAAQSQYEKLARAAGIQIAAKGRDDANQGPKPIPLSFLAAVQAGAQLNAQVPKIGDPIQLENVVQLPTNVSVDVPGLGVLEFQRGEWLRLDLALAVWEIMDRASGQQPLKYLTLENLRTYWFGNLIGRLYCFNREYPTWVDPIRADRINVVRDAYRRIFRIARPWLDNIHRWDTRSVTIVDPITRTRALPFVSAQFCEVPNMRPPVLAQRQARVSAINIDDYSSNKQSPFTVSDGDSDLGILTIEPMRDLEAVVRERIRGKVDNIPRYDLNPDGSILWYNASLNSEFKLKLYLTVEWGAPDTKERLFLVKKDVTGQGGQGGLLEIGSMLDTARIDKDGKVVNAEILAKAADYETRQIMFSHRDVGIGYIHFGGFHTDLVPDGFCRGVSFVVEQGFAYTMYDLTEPYNNRPPQAMMDPRLRKFVYRIAEA